MNEFSERVTLVTDAPSGIGRLSAKAFAAAGSTLVLADVDEVAGELLEGFADVRDH